MYVNSTKNGKMALKDDSFNPAVMRAATDDAVTLPESWANAHPFSQRRRLYDALNVTGIHKGEDWQMGILHDSVTERQPDLKNVDKNDKSKGVTTRNRDFKPKAKQVFAALNYGRRPRGSITHYGFSHLVLNKKFNEDAFYYPEDTFNLGTVGVDAQASFNTIGAVLLKSKLAIQDAIWKACYMNVGHLRDTDEMALLLEAHIFKTIKISAKYIDRAVVSKSRLQGAEFSASGWDTITANALEWKKQTKIPVEFID